MKRVLFWAFALILSVNVAFGQAISQNGGAIEGTITDPSGAAIPHASIVISKPDTGYSKSLESDNAGFYTLGPLVPGNYKIVVTAPNFAALSVATVVRTGTVTPGTFKLMLGKSSEVVEVNAGAVQVNTDQIQVADVITQQQIDTLPVNGRNFLDVAQIEPGVILQQGSSFDPTKAGYSAISVSGVSGRTTRILLDGQDITDEFVGTTIMNVSEGSIAEFQLNRSTQDVSGDVTSTGQVLVATRSGTNKVHGMAFYNFQDYRSLFASQTPGSVSSPFQRNQYGGSIGGPILKDRLFYFLNLERIQQSQSAATLVGSQFASIASKYPTYGSPFKDEYMAGRLDYNGPWGGHYFFRGAYNFNGAVSNFGNNFQLYTNRDNTYGFSGGADFVQGKFTHSIRGSYEKFHNFIGDDTIGNTNIYDPIPGLTFRYVAQNLYTGPNVDAPQGTFQSDKQVRYDGTYTYRTHLIKFGGSLNRIQSAAFANFFGLAPRLTITAGTALNGTASSSNPLGLGCNGVAAAAPCLSDPINGYDASAVTIGNGQGLSSEIPGFGLNGGGANSWRIAGYVGDTYKITPSLTMSAGIRWSVDTNRENNDLAQPTCAKIGAAVAAACAGVPSSTGLFTLYNPGFTGSTHQPYGNFAPQVGFNFSPGNHKTSFRAGAGIFYESVVFNNTSNARSNLLSSGAFYASKAVCSTFSVTFPDGSVHTTSPDGTSLQVLCQQRSVAQAAPQFIAFQKQYQANTAANSAVANGGYIGATLNAAGLYAPNYRTPYSEQWNFGVQRELFKGAVISVDYVHNATLKIGQTLDVNHLGAARTFNKTNASAAIAAMLTACGAGTVQAAITPGGCAVGSGGAPGAKYATISDFAKKGLDSAATYSSAYPASYNGQTVVAAFPGLNQNLGSGAFIQPVGKSAYDALQVVFRSQRSHPLPFVESSNLQVSYNLSRAISTASAGSNGSGDEFFTNAVYDNDNPTAFMGRSSLDRTNQVSMGGSFVFKYGPRLGIIGHFFSSPPGTLGLDTQLANGGIFQTDLTGDGTVGDIAPGTMPGSYMRQIKGQNVQSYINNFNQTRAGQLTPAGQAVVASGLITQAQLVQMGGAIQPLASTANGRGLNNPTLRLLDMSVSYPISLHRLREGLSLEPSIAFYNVGNFSNFGNQSTTLYNTTTAGGSTYTGTSSFIGQNTFGVQSTKRTVRGTGTFDQGAPRSVEYGLKLNF